MTFSALLWLVALHGSEKSIFKFLPVYVDRKEWGHYHGFVRFHAAVAILFAGIIALVGTVLAIYPSDTLVKSGRDVLQYHPLLLALWLLPLTALANLLDKIPRLFHRMLLSLVPIKILLPLITLAILYGLRLYGLTVDRLARGRRRGSRSRSRIGHPDPDRPALAHRSGAGDLRGSGVDDKRGSQS